MKHKNCFRALVFIVCMLFISGCGDNNQPSEENLADETKDSPPKQGASSPLEAHTSLDTLIKVFVNDLPLTGYGYNIFIGAKIYIHQPNIPAVAGNTGFSTEENAFKTASLVLYKIKNNIVPPSLDVKELDSLGVLN